MLPPLPAVVARTLAEFVSRLRAHFGARLVAIRLFGSYSRGDAHAESDVDVLVLLDEAARVDNNWVCDQAADLIWQMGAAVISPLIMSEKNYQEWLGLERVTPQAIEREGIPL